MDVKIAKFDIVGIAPLSYSKVILTPKERGETSGKHEDRCWRERLHVDSEGLVFLPAMALKKQGEAAGKALAETIPGKGKKTYTNEFKTGTMVMDNLRILVPDGNGKWVSIKSEDVEGQRVFVPADGKPGGGSRVWKIFPTIPQWRTSGIVHVMSKVLCDEMEKVHEYAIYAGQFLGMGSFAARVGGLNGRYLVENWTVEDFVASAA